MNPDWIIPDWPAPAVVRAFSTTRNGGFSTGPWRSLNFGLRSGDDPLSVSRNRTLLRTHVPAEPHWLQQVHGARVVEQPTSGAGSETLEMPLQPDLQAPTADAQVARNPNRVCVVLSADCLPVLFCNRDGSQVAAAHAGWRGMLAGVLEKTVIAMKDPTSELLAWLGPAIGPSAYEVGDDVRDQFVAEDAESGKAFRRRGQAWLFDLYSVARMRLARVGLTAVSGGTFCTFSEPERFFSFRRDGQTGRMASLIWIASRKI